MADKYPRRTLLLIANIARALCFVFWLNGTFLFFALGFIFWGIKNALTGGTFEALIYDELKNLNQQQLYEKVNGKIEGSRFLGVALSAALGGFVAQYSFPLTLMISTCTSLIAGIMILTIKPVKKTQDVEKENQFQIFKKAIIQTRTNIPLLLTIVFICLVFATYGANDEFWALIYQKFGLPIDIIGILIAIGYALFSFAGYTAHLFDKQKIKNIENILLLTCGCSLIIAAIIKNIFAVPLIFLALYCIQVANVKIEAKLQHQIASNQRATIFSIKSFLFELVYMFFVFLFGVIGDHSGIISILIISGGLIGVSTISFWALLKYSKFNH